MKTIAAATAVALSLAAAPMALAQTSAPTPAPAVRPATPAANVWYSHQAGEMRASKLIGTSVKNPAGETIGEVNEVVLGRDGNVAALIIGVGGFLGIGEREVAIGFDAVQKTVDERGNLALTVNATKDALKAAPAWEWKSSAAAK
jgi:sporulation protein YlmC with PRC-barrel domain